MSVGISDPSVGRLDNKMNKGCTVTAQPQQREEASCQLPVRVQSWLMDSKKALRKRGNFRNSKTTNSLSHFEGCLIKAKVHWIPCKWHLKVVCTGSRWSALGHWGPTRADEDYGLTTGDGEPEYITQPSLEWPKRVSVG